MSTGSDNKDEKVAAAAPRLPQLRSDLYSSWIFRCEAKFQTSGLTSESTMVDYAIHVIPDGIPLRLQLTPIYAHATPWMELKAKLKTILGDDPRASINKIMSRDLSNGSGLLRHSELERMLENVIDLRSVLIKWAILDMVSPAKREAFAGLHWNKDSYTFAQEVDAFLSRQGGSHTIFQAVRKPTLTPKSNSDDSGICFYQKKFGKKTLICKK